MPVGTFDRETLKDVTVNIVSLAVLVYFAVTFVVFNPWERTVFTYLSLFLIMLPFVVLATVTYVSGALVSGAEAAD